MSNSGAPFSHWYLSKQALTSCAGCPPIDLSTLPADDTRVLSKQRGAIVLELNSSLVYKSGSRIRRNEEVAMRLVKQYTDVPVPDIMFSAYHSEGGNIGMTIIPKSPLQFS
ncbi:uncharacterized protein LY89DRAFT_685474 [Mollisia scopiformis]|uniref:Uncharacterized protein n=1 Tax=Mollisia scopiformis TaxID=149040 RepID=A0A194X8N1_MOLSC|nr:uncharacterized protein LY89DRAFT_685474 [Mollisia scopiformis]KUJ16525.1 hypothetical protein LY89DRAFT_685474 [Mollisia scopiformis]